jgi:subtilisin family serine protease
MTVGLTQELLTRLATQNLTQDADALNTLIKTTLNEALNSVSLSDQLNIKAVSAVPKAKDGSDDGVRFFELGGNLAPGVNFASALLKSSAVQDVLSTKLQLTSGKAFDFVEDSFRVAKTGRVSARQSTADSTQQWAYSQTKLDEAKTVANELADVRDQVVVAVIDTGVDLSHPALQDNLYKVNGELKGYDFANNDADPSDDDGHGTHCAGIIAAKKVDDSGMTGVAEMLAPGKVKIMPIKALGSKGGSTDAVNKAIRYAMAEGAHVISMSLGGGVDFQNLISSNGTESQIIRDAVDAGIIVVVAAGNENCPLGGECKQQTLFVLSQTINEYTVLPCSYNGTICVGASDPDATLASYSNFPSSQTKGVDPSVVDPANKRSSPDITAPGSSIYSTYLNGGYKMLDGTSMAAPYVSGLAALFQLKAAADKRNTDGSPQQTFRRILQEAELDLSTEGDETRSYVGQVDLAHYLKKLRELNTAAASGPAPTLQAVDEPEGEEVGEAPNALAAICGG